MINSIRWSGKSQGHVSVMSRSDVVPRNSHLTFKEWRKGQLAGLIPITKSTKTTLSAWQVLRLSRRMRDF